MRSTSQPQIFPTLHWLRWRLKEPGTRTALIPRTGPTECYGGLLCSNLTLSVQKQSHSRASGLVGREQTRAFARAQTLSQSPLRLTLTRLRKDRTESTDLSRPLSLPGRETQFEISHGQARVSLGKLSSF